MCFNPQSVQLPANCLEVAKEFGFNIKKEPQNDDDEWYTKEVVQANVQQCTDCKEKETSLKQMEEFHGQEVEKLKKQIQDLVNEQDGENKQCSKCEEKESYREHIQKCHTQEIENFQQQIQDLMMERNNLNMELKRFRAKEEYEVEQILGHKNTRKDQKFLVRWKGYDSSHDMWVSKQVLNCPAILNKYMKVNNLN